MKPPTTEAWNNFPGGPVFLTKPLPEVDGWNKRVMLRCECPFCGYRWSVEPKPDPWLFECPDCDRTDRLGDLRVDRDCEGEIPPLWFYPSFSSEPRVWGPVPYWPGLWV